MQSLRTDNGDSHEAPSDAGNGLSGEPHVSAVVGELTMTERDLQLRLVRESLVLRAT